MADPYQYTPDRYVERQKAIERWKRRQDDFPDGEYAMRQPSAISGTQTIRGEPVVQVYPNVMPRFVPPARRLSRVDWIDQWLAWAEAWSRWLR
jgi:hypothetical protein